MISVVIVNYHSAHLTKKAVNSILEDGEEVEVFVVDNTATEEERSLLRDVLGSNVTLLLMKRMRGLRGPATGHMR